MAEVGSVFPRLRPLDVDKKAHETEARARFIKKTFLAAAA